MYTLQGDVVTCSGFPFQGHSPYFFYEYDLILFSNRFYSILIV